MSIASKSLRVFALLILLVLGLAGIVVATNSYTSSKVPVGLLGDGSVFLGQWDDGLVVARGTWALDNEASGIPLNTHEIHCVQSEGRCLDAEAAIFLGQLSATLSTYDITRWDTGTLEFRSDAVCV